MRQIFGVDKLQVLYTGALLCLSKSMAFLGIGFAIVRHIFEP